MTLAQLNKKYIYAYCAKYRGSTNEPLWIHIQRRNVKPNREYHMPGPDKAVKALLVKPDTLKPAEDEIVENREAYKDDAPLLNVIIEVGTLYAVLSFFSETKTIT